MPISNSELERTVSNFGFIKNSLRNRLLDETTNDLLFIYKMKIS
jgi:hypothetical protein